MNGAERIAVALRAHGVPAVFSTGSAGIEPILVAAKTRGIRVIGTRFDATAVAAADAFGRQTGTPGVAVIEARPGLAHAGVAVKTAELAQSPLLLIGSAEAWLPRGRGGAPEVDLQDLPTPSFKWTRQVEQVRDLVPALEEAMAAAATGIPGPVYVECPVDLLADEAQLRGRYRDDLAAAEQGGFLHGSSLERRLTRMFAGAEHLSAPRVHVIESAPASISDIRRAATVLDDAHRPLLVLGRQALLAPQYVPELIEAIERLGLPVLLVEQACGLLGREHRLLIRHRLSDALHDADCIIAAGLLHDSGPFWTLERRSAAKLIALGRAGAGDLSLPGPELALIGDVALSLIELSRQAAGRGVPDDWLAGLRARDHEPQQATALRDHGDTAGIDPEVLLRAVDQSLDNAALVIGDGGVFVARAAQVLHPPRPFSWLDCGRLGVSGSGAGFALAAWLADRGTQPWLLWDDAACARGVAEVATLVHHRVPVIVVVANAAPQEALWQDVAQGFHAVGLTLTRNEDLADELRQARNLAAVGQAVLIDARLAPVAKSST